MTHTPTLRPCPFCGGIDLHECSTLPHGQAWYSCNDCEMEGPNRPTQDAAITAWNTRFAEQSEVQDA